MNHPALEIENLVVHYGEKLAVDRISIRVERGEHVGYLGPNGAGKSTTLKAIVGMTKPASGSIRVAGIDALLDPMRVKQAVGFLHESGAVYDVLTPREHCTLVADLRGLDRAHVSRRADELFEILDLPADTRDKRMHDFSKGMKQKVAIVSALLHEPELLLLDEPLNGLDVNATSRFKELLNEYLHRGGTVLYSSHLLDVVERVCSRAVIIHQGRVLADLAIKELPGLYPGKTLEGVFQQLTGYKSIEAGSTP